MEWVVAGGPIAYTDAVGAMERHVAAIARGAAAERVWLLEHPSLYTVGTGADFPLERGALPWHRTGRGGQVTYHGPGQRVAYVMLDLRARSADVRAFVSALERWLIATLAAFDVAGERREDRVGVWVRRPDKAPGRDGTPVEDKIAALGIRLRRWISFHGIALNVEPDLSLYRAIVPCGIAEPHYGVTSLADLGRAATMAQVDAALRAGFEPIFGPTRSAPFTA